jgi:hypothetical protein
VSLPDEFVAFLKSIKAKRAKTIIDHILQHGQITTEELQDVYGYKHPPRGARDVREQGVPIETFTVKDAAGKSIAAYRFGDPSAVKHGRHGGRRAFSKPFKNSLMDRYGEKCTITGEPFEDRYLQIDHRIPYEVGGDSEVLAVEDFMLLDASTQRAKSWSCENCRNLTELKDRKVCETCFWAFPEAYTHIAMQARRRIDLHWIGSDEVAKFVRLVSKAEMQGLSVTEFARQVLDQEID